MKKDINISSITIEDVKKNQELIIEYHNWLEERRIRDKKDLLKEIMSDKRRLFRMGQADILEFLKNNKGKKFTIVELCDEFSAEKKSVSRCLLKLSRSCFICRGDFVDGNGHHFVKYWV